MKPVTIYSTTYCGYCRAAKSLLEKLNIPYTEIDVTDDDAERARLVERTRQRTVPQIFFGDDHVGGYTDLKAVVDAGQLQSRLGSAATPT